MCNSKNIYQISYTFVINDLFRYRVGDILIQIVYLMIFLFVRKMDTITKYYTDIFESHFYKEKNK